MHEAVTLEIVSETEVKKGRDLGIQLDYRAIDAAPEHFVEALMDFAETGGSGANITLPLKELAAGLCAELSDGAARAGAVNTLIALPGGRWRGDNTDGIGLIADLQRLGVAVSDRRLLVLGAGGSVRGILSGLLAARPATLQIANRTQERAQQLAAEFAPLGPIGAIARNQIDGAFDLVIHATSAYRVPLPGELPRAAFAPQTIAYDLSYGDAAAGFIAAVRAIGVRAAHDGLGMLIEQAAEAFERWHGVHPETAPVHQELRASMSAP